MKSNPLLIRKYLAEFLVHVCHNSGACPINHLADPFVSCPFKVGCEHVTQDMWMTALSKRMDSNAIGRAHAVSHIRKRLTELVLRVIHVRKRNGYD